MQKLVEIGVNGTAQQKERAKEAEALQGQIFNSRFALRLSFLTDVYNTFGFGVNSLQVVNSLAFVKLDVFNKGVLQRYEDMVKTINTENCTCRHYIKRGAGVYKDVSDEGSEESDSNDDYDNEEDREEVNNNISKMPEDFFMQLDGLGDLVNDEEDSDDDNEDDSRPNIFTSQHYLDNLSDTTSVAGFLPPPPITITSTQDYLDAMSDSVSSVPRQNVDMDDVVLEGDTEELEDASKAGEVKYIPAEVEVSEGRRVFTVKVEKEIVKEYCYFPNSHQDIREMRSFGTYRGYPIGSLLPDPVHAGTRSGRRQQNINVLLNSEDIIKEVEKKIIEFVNHLKSELTEKVFTPQTKSMIENLRTVLDVQSLVKKLVTRSPSDLANILYQSFRTASIVIEPNLFIDFINEAELRVQYRDYLKKLKLLLDENTEMKNWDSLEILTKLFKSTTFSVNVEAIMGILARAMVTIGIESVVESWVSVMESHDSKNRPLGEKMVLTETAVNLNGPNPVNCESVVDEANKLYWSKCKLKNSDFGHFIRTSLDIKSWTVSKSVDQVNSTKPKLPFMI